MDTINITIKTKKATAPRNRYNFLYQKYRQKHNSTNNTKQTIGTFETIQL